MICGAINNHQPLGHPWSLSAMCQKPKEHTTSEDKVERMHEDTVEDHRIMWL